MPAPTIKGVAFRTVLRVVERSKGLEVVERAYAAMPDELSKALRYGELIPAGWYPVTSYRAMWGAILGVSGESDSFVRQIGREAVDADFNSLYRALLRVLTPRTLVSVGMKHFGQIYDTGSVEVVEPTRQSVRLRFVGCLDFDHTMWIEILGSCERLAELAGGRGAHSTILEGGRDGDARCVASVQWT